MSHPPTYGEVPGRPVGEMSRRGFMRNVFWAATGLLTLEFLAGTVNFLWPNVRTGLGGKFTLGKASDIAATQATWASGQPFAFGKARVFFINVPAAKSLVDGSNETVADPGAEVLALYRKCPHLGCQIPTLCEQSHWFECLCHGSKYTILGEKRAGPAPRGMDSFAVDVVDGVYVIDTSAIVGGKPIGTATFDNRDTNNIPHCAA
ncbi:MAG: Rieske 2Fe-2S domain-containing protein [Chloroflexota bacterium]|nr:Rieske 2Fe-2S domain-containing protein [Chloroflexota bacterium]